VHEAFLEAAGWTGAAAAPVAGDASGRRYERLALGGRSAILMRAPPGSGREIERFARLAGHLRAHGLSAPEVLAAAPDLGFMLLEDLGNRLYSTEILSRPHSTGELYRTALDCLALLHSVPPPDGIEPFTPREMAEQAALAHTLEDTGPCPYEAPLEAALAGLALPGPVLMLRDFHAGNLFWLPDREGPARVGLIDFQDARLSSPLYDVVSLLWDARLDMAPALRADLLAHAAEALGQPLEAVIRDAATLNLQRNLRIFGVFQRHARDAGKTAYLRHLPRVRRHIEEALAAPHLVPLRAPVRACLARHDTRAT